MGLSTDLYLAPIPKRLTRRDGVFCSNGKLYIRLDSPEPSLLLPAAKKAGLPWQITASPKAPADQVGLIIRIEKDSSIRPEGYSLSITSRNIEIVAADPAGAYYGACTLLQIIRNCQASADEPTVGNSSSSSESINLPCLSISDWPDFPARGVMLDISRDKTPTMDTLFHLVDLLSEWKINQFQLYTEASFAYLAHPTVWENATPMTGEEVLALDAYCKSRFVELVPNQNSFGHLERWLKHEKYNSMAEAPKGCDTIWGFRNAFSLCPTDKRSIPFVRGLFDELLPHFTSRMFNVGLDETIDLGCGRSKKVCKERGKGRVYLDFLLQIQHMVEERGRTMQFWGDIIVQHPELIPELPKNVIALEWGYEQDHPFGEHCATFAESGVPFYVCPGNSAWRTISGRTENAVKNLANAAKNGFKHGAIGFLNTEWGDNGHWQPLSVSYLGFMAGAMASWNAKADFNKVLPRNLSLHAFGDLTGSIGQAYYDLGNVYLAFKQRLENSAIPFHVLIATSDDFRKTVNATLGEFEEMERRLSRIATAEAMTAPDAEIVRQEFDHLMKMLNLAAKIGQSVYGEKPGDFRAQLDAVRERQRHIWLLRNRQGGLENSLKWLRSE